MNAKTGAQLQRDQQWSAEAEDAHIAQIDAALKDLHVCLPGIVQSFDPATQTAVVQPALQRLFIGDGFKNLPPLVDVPVVFPAGGGNGAASSFILTFPVAAKDEVLLHFSERAIDFWHEKGGVQLPAEYRLHDLSDAFAQLGISSKPRVVPNISTDGVELRTRDGATLVRVEGSAVYIGAKSGANPFLMATPDVLTWLGAVGTGSMAGPPPTDIASTKAQGV